MAGTVRGLAGIEKTADVLLRQKVISAEQAEKIRALASPSHPRRHKRHEPPRKEPLPSAGNLPAFIAGLGLVFDGKNVDEEVVARAMAREAGLPFRKIDTLELKADVVTGVISKPFALKHMAVPLEKVGGDLVVAVADPDNSDVEERIELVSGFKVRRVVSTAADIERAINQFFGFRSTVKQAEKGMRHGVGLSDLEQLSALKSEEEISSSDQHVQSAVDLILHYALANRASDIHIEPKREETVVRMRIDGTLNETHRLPRVVHGAVLSRIKLLSRMDISEKRRPQDGRIKVQKEGKESEMRVSVLPVVFGEKAVLRIFDPETAFRGVAELGFYPEDLERYKRFLGQPHGVILVTGPTGSGKTSTLYSSLKHIHSPERNIVTIEDPVEIVVPEFNQVAVQTAIDMTFAIALRAILRQDPDVIMIGEIRDKETAQNAVQAALTGHLVLSTLHTNDTASSLTRLFDLGIEPYLVKNSLIGVVAQRLVRVVCARCKAPHEYSPAVRGQFGLADGAVTLMKGEGCDACRGTGYYGRTGVHEVMEISGAVRPLIDGKTPDQTVKRTAMQEGMKTLKENAVKKMLEGTTTPEEVLRLTGI